MNKIAVEGDKELLEALAQRWEKNGWEDISCRSASPDGKHLCAGGSPDGKKPYGIYFHNYPVAPKTYTLPDDWNELADLKPEPVVEKGQYWENSDGLFRIMGLSTEYIKGCHGKQILSGENCVGFHINAKDVVQDYNLLSPEEVEKHLIEEAKRRGFEKGTRYRCVLTGSKERILDNFIYSPDFLTDECGGAVYNNGEWAEIIDQAPEIKINGYTAEFHDDYVQFGCAKIKVTHLRTLYNDLKDYMHGDELNNIFTNDYKWFNGIRIGKGVFTISDLKQIVDHYK